MASSAGSRLSAKPCRLFDAKSATHHVTEIVAGEAVEYHVCDMCLKNLEGLEKATQARTPDTGYRAFVGDPELRAILQDADARQKVAAHLLPPLCLALLDPKPEVKVVAAFRLMAFGPDAHSALGALKNAQQDPDERVRKAARFALEYVQSNEPLPWFI